ncbi:S49 family peptidase, partial [Salmonella enterica]|nr:S49 family peptidase [Salmonella enterica]
MKQFLLTFAAVLLGGFVLLMIPLIIISAIATAAMSDSPAKVEPGTILKLSLSDAISDRDTDSPANRARALLSGDDGTSHGLNTLRDKLDMAAADDNVCAIYLAGSGVAANYANMRDIRRAIQEFKAASGKPVFYFGSVMSDGSEYVASAADSIFLTPTGSVLLSGCTSTKIYFKRMADKFGIGFDVIKHGKYKSAVEPYFRDSMSDEDREQTLRYLDVIWSEVRDSIAAGRRIAPADVDAYV